MRRRIIDELEAFEMRVTQAGNQVLNVTRDDNVGHGDLAIAAALALYHSNTVAGFTGEAPVAGYWANPQGCI